MSKIRRHDARDGNEDDAGDEQFDETEAFIVIHDLPARAHMQ